MTRQRTAEEIVELLCAASEESFYSGLAALESSTNVSVVVSAAARLATAPLPELRRSERLAAVLRKVHLGPPDLRIVARTAASASPVMSNAVAAFLPASERRRRTSATRSDVSAQASQPTDAPAGSSEEIPVPLVQSAASDDGSRTVLILSAPAQQEANITLLKESGFSPFVYDSVSKVISDLATNVDICGFVVDRSFLAPLSISEQEELFELLAAYSTFSWVRVDDPGLKIKHERVYTILRSIRLQTQPVAAHHVSMQPNGTMRESELGALHRASDVLREHAHATFLPAELEEHERRLLVAAAREHGEQFQFQQMLRVEVIETRFVHGGQSQARVAIVRVNAGNRAVVAKVHTKDAIRQELERFRLFVQPVDDQLQPFVCFHGSAAVMIFAFIPHEDDPSVAAETLQSRLHRFWCDEIFAQPTTTQYDNLCKALSNTAAALARVNRQQPAGGHAPLGNPDMTAPYIERLEKRGIEFGLPVALRDTRSRAAARFKRLERSGVVHGDLHLANILLRGDRSAHLIDFAASGPGHPAVDLVRLEVSLFTGCFLAIDTEDSYCDLQRALSLDGADFETLSERFRLTDGPTLNRLSVHGCVEARRHALDVLAFFGGDIEDYLAVKCLVAWQTLLLENRQTSLVRAVIRSIGERWS